jgi:hypothetical protein
MVIPNDQRGREENPEKPGVRSTKLLKKVFGK